MENKEKKQKISFFSKKSYVVIGIVLLAIVAFAVFILPYIPIGFECGHWFAYGGQQKSCECIGIKTGLCPPGASCSGGDFKCIGICKNCVCWTPANETNPNPEKVPC
ncbi:MAG: hypothetical protein N3F05_04540 [Candidatus Diapherotrites archaeon]|nr:hypothetical protein [Candidatus Diapherotrites archaeon]